MICNTSFTADSLFRFLQVLKFSQADVDKMLKERESELQLKEREWNRKLTELSAEKMQKEEQIMRLQKSHEDMKYASLSSYFWPISL